MSFNKWLPTSANPDAQALARVFTPRKGRVTLNTLIRDYPDVAEVILIQVFNLYLDAKKAHLPE